MARSIWRVTSGNGAWTAIETGRVHSGRRLGNANLSGLRPGGVAAVRPLPDERLPHRAQSGAAIGPGACSAYEPWA